MLQSCSFQCANMIENSPNTKQPIMNFQRNNKDVLLSVLAVSGIVDMNITSFIAFVDLYIIENRHKIIKA